MVQMGTKYLGKLLLFGLLIAGLVGCALPQVQAEDRLFLPLNAEVLDVYRLPPQDFQGTMVGGLSALTYDREQDQFYVLSDDRGNFGPARFYTLSVAFRLDDTNQPRFDTVSLNRVIPLKDAEGHAYPKGALDPEGLALSPRDTLLISSEGDVSQNAPPFVGEYDRNRGTIVTSFRVPERFLPDDATAPTRGIRENLSLESLTINAPSGAVGMIEPFRLFTATESSLIQDYNEDPAQPLNTRFLHYLIGENQSTLIAEHLYPLDLEPPGALINGLSELLVIDQGGHFLALERAFGLRDFRVRLYQLATGGATDTSTILSLKGNLEGVSPIRKRLILDFADTDIDVDNLEGMTLGPRLPDGSQSLILVSDNNFEAERDTQFVLLRLE
jgi:hypothetical protein